VLEVSLSEEFRLKVNPEGFRNHSPWRLANLAYSQQKWKTRFICVVLCNYAAE